ncbi:MAG: acetylgalactosaminidase [Bacteroidetes bacterium]|nr:MAG: acetylgalactosaminidase [Bacteroidota bacterium]
MKTNRRNFLRIAGLAGVGVAGQGITKASGLAGMPGTTTHQSHQEASQHFNMCGYAAPKLETVRIGFIGLGNRGPHAVERMSHIEGVEIKALCDIRPERIDMVKERMGESRHNPVIYTGKEESWKALCERDDLDLVYICTPWYLHAPMAIYAMKQDKHACVEVPAAKTIDECWELVETSEQKRKHCMMLENVCYGFFELLTLNMARQGFFGDIVHGEGAYIHDLLKSNFSKGHYYKQWRLIENQRNGNLYPTHGLGPIAQIMDINRGDQMDYLVALSSKDAIMEKTANALAAEDKFFVPFSEKSYRGNMNTTTIRTKRGRSIMVQHDVSSPRPYSRIHLVSGTQGIARQYPEPARISQGHEWFTDEEFKAVEEKYRPKIVERVGELAKELGGHGGMDFIMDWRTIDCLRNGLALDQDVYDAALWSSIAPLSEWSVANRSNSIDVPDFTRGAWKKNPVVDISLRQGGDTGVLL